MELILFLQIRLHTLFGLKSHAGGKAEEFHEPVARPLVEGALGIVGRQVEVIDAVSGLTGNHVGGPLEQADLDPPRDLGVHLVDEGVKIVHQGIYPQSLVGHLRPPLVHQALEGVLVLR